MNNMLLVNKINKKYPKFSLKDVSFEIKPGEIMGFIGRNGAGKTTTLKAIMNLIHYESGEIYAFEREMKEHELDNKQRIGFTLSELNYYPNKTIKQLVDVVSKCYKNFDMSTFDKLCELFSLDINKKLEELSSGMKVKYSLALALSHNAELLILDEPTSGLDPVSRDEILDLFKEIVRDKNKAILFSTHITSDLDKCASHITYIKNGEIIFTGKKKEFIDSYLLIKDESKNEELLKEYVSYKDEDDYIFGLISQDKKDLFVSHNIIPSKPDLEDIMILLERGIK